MASPTRRAVLLLGLLLSGCADPFGPDPPIPPDAVSITPDESWGFRDFWAQVQTDSGRTGSFDRISWYLAPSGPWIGNEGLKIRGLWVRRGHRIYLAEGSQGNGRVVRHEMLHELLDDPSHDHPLFDTEKYNSRSLIDILGVLNRVVVPRDPGVT